MVVARAEALHDYAGEEDVEDAQFLLFEQVWNRKIVE